MITRFIPSFFFMSSVFSSTVKWFVEIRINVINSWKCFSMKKVYYLSTCSTCKRIIKELNLPQDFEMQDIKTEKICENKLNEMISLAGSAEAIFSKRSMKYRAMGLHERELEDYEMNALILDEYTFLKRPIFIIDNDIFVGNSKKTVEAVKEKLNS